MEPNSIIPDNISVGLVSEPSTLSPSEKGSIIMPSSVNVGEFSDLKPEGIDYGLLSGMNQDVNRASNQSGLDQLGNFLMNAGAEILGGTIEGAGYLADFEQHANLIKGTEEEFSNWFSDLGKSLKESANENFPIYEAKPGEFNPSDPGFWAKNGVSIASSLSLLIPARGATGLLSMLGKGLGAERLLAKGASLLGKEGEAYQVAIRAAKQNTKGITAAVLSRTMENTMEASGTFEEIYNTKLAEGYSEEEARNSAAQGASEVWYQNSLMLIQDIPQYMFLFKAPGLLKSEGKQLQKLISTTTLKDVGKQFVSEAGEEVYQSVVGQEAKAKQLQTDIYNQLSFEERLSQYLKEDEVLTSALFGGLGGSVVTLAGRAWENQVAKKYQNYEDMKLAASVGKDNLVQQIKDKQSVEIISSKLDDLDKVKEEIEEISKEEGADKTQIQNVLSDIEVAEQTKNSLIGIVPDEYIAPAIQLNIESNQAARRFSKTQSLLEELKQSDSVKAQLNKVGSQAFDYNVSVNALRQIGKLRNQYSKNPIAQEVLDEMEKEHTKIVTDLAEYNKPINGITAQLNSRVNDLLVNEIEHRTKSKEFEEVSIGNTSPLEERLTKAKIEQVKGETNIDKLLEIRDGDNEELSKAAKTKLKELYSKEDKIIPENIEKLTSFYEKNPLTFKAELKKYGLPTTTTLEEFKNIVQTPEFINQFESKKETVKQDNKVKEKEQEVIDEVNQPSQVETDIITTKDIPVESTPIISTDEKVIDKETTEDKKADTERRRQEGTNLRGTTYKGETTEKDGLKITKYSEFRPDGKRISKGGRIMTPAEFIKEYNITDQDYLDSLEGATEIRIYEVREGKDTTGISIQGTFPEGNIEMEVAGAELAALENETIKPEPNYIDITTQEEQEVIDEIKEFSQVETGNTTTKDIPVESTPIASTDEDVIEIENNIITFAQHIRTSSKARRGFRTFKKTKSIINDKLDERLGTEGVYTPIQYKNFQEMLPEDYYTKYLYNASGSNPILIKSYYVGEDLHSFPARSGNYISHALVANKKINNPTNVFKNFDWYSFDKIKKEDSISGVDENIAEVKFKDSLKTKDADISKEFKQVLDIIESGKKVIILAEDKNIKEKLFFAILDNLDSDYVKNKLSLGISSNEKLILDKYQVTILDPLIYEKEKKSESINFNEFSIFSVEDFNISINDINKKLELTNQQFDITSQEEQDDLVDTKEDTNGLDSNPNRVKTTDAYVYYWDGENETFVIPSMKDGRFTVEEFNNKYQVGKQEKGYHVLYGKDGQVIFFPRQQEPTLDIDFLRNLGQVGDVFKEPITLEVDKDYVNGDKTWSNSKALEDNKNGWKYLKIAIKMQGKTIGFLGDANKVDGDPLEIAQFEQLRKTIFNNTKSSQGIYVHPKTTTFKSINAPRFWQGTRTKDLTSITNKPIILGLVKNGKLFLNNSPLSDKEREDLEGKFNLSDGAVYWLLTNPVTNEYVPYRLFTSKIGSLPNKQKRIRELFEEITEQNWSEKRKAIQSIVRWSEGTNYGPDFGYTKSGKFFIVKDGEKAYDVQPNQAYDSYINERGYNLIDDSPVQVESDKLNQAGYNEAVIKQGYFEANLNAGLFHSPNFRINLEPLVKDVSNTEPRRITRGRAKFSKKDNRQVTKWNEQEETQWFKDKIGELIDLNVVDEAEMNSLVESLKHIHNQDNVEAWGFFHNAAVWISKNAKSGTTMHEAFHVIFNLALTKTQQESLLNWGAKEYGINRNKKADNELMFSIAQNVNEAQIEYTLKIVDALNKIQRNKFDKSKLQGWLNDLSKYGVTKQQLEIFQEYAKDGMTKEEIIASISADLSFVVESNVAKKQTLKDNSTDGFILNGWYYRQGNITGSRKVARIFDRVKIANENVPVWEPEFYTDIEETITEEEYLYARSKTGENASFYSNLTVPGGTNYTENEIRTPNIIPSIKGHAQFSTENGIGWFRSDDKQRVRGVGIYTKEQANKDLKEGKISEFEYEMASETFDIESPTETDTKTRRILEVQSDLFQKGRDNKYLTDDSRDLDEERFKDNVTDKNALEKNQFLQLLNKDNNWVTFFIKSIIQDSAKKGYEKVLFPKGETAAKIEGHETIADEIRRYDDIINNADKYYTKGNEVLPEGYNAQINYNDDLYSSTKEGFIAKAEQKKQELKSQGIEKLKPVENFYENVVKNILKKNYNVNEVTDEYGNTWNEIDLTSLPKETILLSTSREEYYKQLSGDVQIEEKLADAFAEYVQMAQVDEAKLKLTPWYKQLGASIKRLFRKMYLAIKASVGLNLSQDEIFFRINSGAYKNNKGFKKNVDVFKPSIKAYVDNLKQQDRLAQVQREFNELYIQFRNSQKEKNKDISEQKILDMAIKPTFGDRLNEDNIYYKLSQTFLEEAKGSRLDGDEYAAIEYEELSKKLYDPNVVSDRIRDKFGPMYWNALDNLKDYGIRVNRLQGDLEINDEIQDSLENWMEVHPPSAYESLSKQIKMGLAALPKGEFVGEEYEAELDDLGYTRFVDPFEVYSFLKDELSDSLSVEDYMERLEKLGKDIGWAKVLHQILSGSRPSTIIVDIELFKSQLYQFVQEPEPTFKYLLQTIKNKKEGQFEWRFNNSASKSIANRLSQTWISNVASPLYNKVVTNNKLEEVKKELGEYIKDNKDDNNWLYKTTNDLGIILSREVIDIITTPKKGNKRDFLKNLQNVVNNIGEDNFEQKQSVQNSLVEMAKLVKKYYPEFHLPAFTNVEGETVQNYIRNSFMARQINKFKSSKYRKDLIDFYRVDKFYGANDRTKKDESGVELRDDSYSLWLDRLQHNDAWKKMDFAVLDGQKMAGETNGTPYADLSPLEFNRMTLNAFYNNGNYKNSKSDVGKSYYSAQIMADSGSHAYIGFESYDNEAIINKLILLAKNEYFAYLHNQIGSNKTGIKGYNPKLMFIPGLIENKNNLTPAQLQEKAVELVQNEDLLRKTIEINLDKIVTDTINSFEKENIIEKEGDGYKSIHLDYKIKDIPEFIKDFVYNDFFAQTQIISLFHGKLYQYKSMEDFYKRAKEIWSPGNFIDTSRKGVNKKFLTYFVGSESTELNYTNNKESVDAIYNNILKAGFSEDDAKKAAVGYGYTDGTNDGTAITLSNGKVIKSDSVDATDAQGIIDIYRWREIMLGKGMESNEVERIFDAIINDAYTLDDLSMVMNPIKQFYYTLINVNGQVSGLQIKNSEYVLLPQIAKGNKQLEGILEFFKQSREKNQNTNASINFDSAVKVGLHKVNKSLKDLSTDKGILLDNSEYRIQGEVPEHQVDTTNLLGTQLRKLIIGDLNWDDVYEVGNTKDKINGKDLISEWNQLLIADIWYSSERLNKEFSDPKKFYKMLQDEAVSRDYPDKFIEALTLIDGKPRLNLFHPLLAKKAQAMIGSIYRNNITKMKFNGMSTPNVAMGSEDLKIQYNVDGSIKHFEAYLPLWSESLIKGMDTITHEELEKLGLDLGVAYRIPTEGKYSMIPIKIKGFTNAGIVLPAEITKVAGLDYDIDKMYVMLYEFITINKKPVKVKFQKAPVYNDYEKSVLYSKDIKKYLNDNNLQPSDFLGGDLVDKLLEEIGGDFLKLKNQYDSLEELLIEEELLLSEEDWNKLNVYQKNSQKARDNRKLDIIRSVLNNPKTIKAQLTPGGFDDLKAEANRIENIKGSQLGKINPMTLISRVKIFARMMAGKKLIGIPANYNATHALMQHNNLELTQPVLFNGFEGKNLGLLQTMDGSKLVSNNFAQYLASVVDNGKDPLADKYNLNTYTADVAMLMAKFFPIELGMKFIAQPSIVEFYKRYVNYGANTKAANKAAQEVAGLTINELVSLEKDIANIAEQAGTGKNYYKNINDDELERGLGERWDDPNQKKMIEMFLLYKNNQAKDLGKLVAAIKVPDSGTASSIAKTVSNIGKVKEALKLESITGIQDFLTNENLANNSLYEKGIIDAMKKFIELGFPDEISKESAFVRVKEKLAELKGSNLSEKEVSLINDALYSFMSSAFLPLKNINTLEIIEKLPTLWNEFIKLDRKEYYALMGSIDTPTSEHDDKRLKLVLNNKQPKDIENKVMNQWENLLNSSKPINGNYTEGDLGKMLVEYAFITNGFRFTTGSLSHIQPISFYENLTDGIMDYNTFIEKQIQDANSNPEYLSNFVDQFVRHYFPRLSYVKSVEKEDGGIRLDEKTKEPYAVVINDFQAKEYVKYRDAESKKWYLFKLNLLTGDGTAFYNRINPLGQYRELEEWSLDSHKVESLFDENNMPDNFNLMVDDLFEANEINEVETKTVEGINISTKATDPLGLMLTNPNWKAKHLMDVEAPYKANASKIKAPHLSMEDALKYDMNLMYELQVKKFKQNPELIDMINERGGLEFIKKSSHTVGVKGSRWEGVGMESNFIKVLAKSYETVAKELNKFVEANVENVTEPTANIEVNRSFNKNEGDDIVSPCIN